MLTCFETLERAVEEPIPTVNPGQVVFDTALEKWIVPEIERRRAAGSWTDSDVLSVALVLLPPDTSPQVRINDEAMRVAKVQVARACDAGEPLQAGDLRQILEIVPPSWNDKPVAYVRIHWEPGGTASVEFDFAPQLDDGGRMNDLLLEKVRAYWSELILRSFGDQQRDLEGIGLWAAPALLPYPLNRIVQFVRGGAKEDARRLLVDHCTPDFIADLIKGWWGVPAFESRRSVFEEALQAHRCSMFTVSVRALVPDVEGVITDWLVAVLPEGPRFREISKAEDFEKLVGASQGPLDPRVPRSICSFIVKGPVYASFKEWSAPVGTNFPGRHPTLHGRFDPDVYSEENSIKCFLLLDSIHRVIVAHEAAEKSRPT